MLGIKHIAIINGYVTNYYGLFRDVPHNHTSMRFRKYISDSNWERIVRKMEGFTFREVHSPFRYLRKYLGLNPKSNLFDEFEGDLNLVCDDPDIFPLNNAPENFHICGPVIYRCNQDESEVIEFVESGCKRPVLFISGGSSGTDIIYNILKSEIIKNYKVVVAGVKKMRILKISYGGS